MSAEERDAYYNIMLPDFAAVSAASVSGGQTPMASLPTTMGTTSYSGYLQLILGTASVTANVIGDATIGVQFDAGTLSGTADGFLGVTLDQNMVQQVVSYEGTIAMTNGTISTGGTGTSAADLQIGGTLDNGLTVFVVDGEMVGGFFGPMGEGLRVRGTNTSIDGNMSVTIDGTPGVIAIGTLSVVQD